MSGKRSIVHVLWDGDLGGVQRYLLKLLGATSWQNCVHTVCFLSKAGRILSEESLPQTKQISLGLTHGSQFLRAYRLHEAFKAAGADVVHCHSDTPASLFHSLLCSRVPVVYHEHGDTLMRKERPWLSGMTWSMLGRRAKSLIAISDYVKSQICLRFPHVGPTMQVIRNPLVEEPSLVRLGHARKPLKVGYFGRLNTLKGADRFLELAFALESQEVSFHIYGDGPLKPALEIHRANQSVSFHGFTNTPMRKMAEMDLVVVPSRVEPFGLVGLEAQSVGVPVLGFRGSGIEEIVSHGKTGWLLPKDDMGAMLSRLRACIHNPEALASMSKAAHMRALQSFSLEQHVQTLEQLYFRIS